MDSIVKGAIATFTTTLMAFTAPANATILKGQVTTNDTQSTQPGLAMSASATNESAQAKVVAGGWNCTSQVVASSCPTVSPGTVIESFIHYLRNTQGAVVQNWQEPGWTPAASAIFKLSDWTFATQKESSIQTAQGRVTARSQEKLKVVNPNTMVAESTVHQYLNGQFIGPYKTNSVMHKVSG